MKKNDYNIIAVMRDNARKSIPLLSRELGIPASTVYEKIKKQYKGLFKKYITLVNFQKLGYHTIINFAISCTENTREELTNYLIENSRINTLHRLNFGWDILAEGIFRNFAEAEDFKMLIKKRFKPIKLECFNVVEELKKEEFLTRLEHFGGNKNG